MTRTVFFSFHYVRDNWRAGQVRNSWIAHDDHEDAGFIDGSDWEEIKQEGEEAIKEWIEDQLNGTSVSAVLIGAETAGRDWVIHEIIRSYEVGNGLVGIYIHDMKNQDGNTDSKGDNPLDRVYTEDNGEKTYMSDIFNTYNWRWDDGKENFGDWVEDAAQIAGR